jgi:hypothetical protein
MNLPAAEAAEVRAKYGSVFTAVAQVVMAGSIDEEDNFFEAEADGEGLAIDEVLFSLLHRKCFLLMYQFFTFLLR